MPAKIQTEPGDLLRIQVSGILREADLREFQATAAREITRAGSIALLFLLEKFEGWDKEGNWGDLEFYSTHGDRIRKIAIVGDEKWRDESLAFAGAGIRKGEVRFFTPAESAPARAWLAEPETGQKGRPPAS